MIGLLWGILGFALVGAHIAFNQLEFLFPAIGAILVALITAFVPGMDQQLWLQIGLWLAFSVTSLVLFRTKFRKSFQGRVIKDSRDEFSGQKAVIVEPVAPGQPGRIRFQGTTWNAVSETEELAEGAEVTILEKTGLGFTVTGQDLETEIRQPRSANQKAWDKLEKQEKLDKE